MLLRVHARTQQRDGHKPDAQLHPLRNLSTPVVTFKRSEYFSAGNLCDVAGQLALLWGFCMRIDLTYLGSTAGVVAGAFEYAPESGCFALGLCVRWMYVSKTRTRTSKLYL